MELLFTLSTLFIVYTYALYPVAIWLLAKRKPAPAPSPSNDVACPEVTVVIAGHNEAHRIEAKFADLRALDYPQNKLHILFVSDGSTDDTAQVAARHADVQVIHYAQRQGKAHALNVAMAQVRTPVVLFNDVRQKAEPSALRNLVASLMQPGVGAVSGELEHYDPSTQSAASIGLYWRYEKWIRRSESAVASVVGATGACYAIHRDGFVPLAPDTLLDDFEIPMQIVRQGRRVLFDGRAVIYDELQKDMEGESKRKIRTLSGNFQSFSRHTWLFSPTANPIWLQFLSHKVFRLLVPYAMVIALGSSMLSDHPVCRAAAVLQIAFYLLAISARHVPALASNRLASFASVFVEMNWIAMKAGIQFYLNRSAASWEKT